MSQAEEPPAKSAAALVEEPPIDVLGILSRLGPGLIIAGSIVGSGELIATTKTGATAGFWLLWLIVIGCIIKVFVQVELGRDAIVRGKTTMESLAEVPGPSIPGRGNWLIWYWFFMFAASAGQLGGIVGSVGQAMSITIPLTASGKTFNAIANSETELQVADAERKMLANRPETGISAAAAARAAQLDKTIAGLKDELARLGPKPESYDPQIWATIFAVITSILLVVGHYKLIESTTTTMVAAFTLVTIVTVFALQFSAGWAIRGQDIIDGFSFRLPPSSQAGSGMALATALSTFGIIGVGASELVAYPYWCLEKGYARFTGPRDATPHWAERARGWMTVLRADAWCSMVVYTLATLAFYLLGAATLGRIGLNPTSDTLVRTLTVMYEPVFGSWAPMLFLIGAFAVLYSTYFVANAGNARILSDAFRVMGFAAQGSDAHRARTRWISGILPFICLAIYLAMPKEPDKLVLISGTMQALMLPMLSAAALFFRYRRSDERVRPGILWDIFLWISALGMLATAASLIYTKLFV
jgi:Mn2+/Fe2+ NRAMP family transporter